MLREHRLLAAAGIDTAESFTLTLEGGAKDTKVEDVGCLQTTSLSSLTVSLRATGQCVD